VVAAVLALSRLIIGTIMVRCSIIVALHKIALRDLLPAGRNLRRAGFRFLFGS
jgi:hypothetical protein